MIIDNGQEKCSNQMTFEIEVISTLLVKERLTTQIHRRLESVSSYSCDKVQRPLS